MAVVQTEARDLLLFGALLFHGAGNCEARVRIYKLHLFSSIDDHQVAVNDAVVARVDDHIAGTVGLHQVGTLERDGKAGAAKISGGSPGYTTSAVKHKMDSFREGHKGWKRDVIGVAGVVDEAGRTRPVAAAKDGTCANIRVLSMKLEHVGSA